MDSEACCTPSCQAGRPAQRAWVSREASRRAAPPHRGATSTAPPSRSHRGRPPRPPLSRLVHGCASWCLPRREHPASLRARCGAHARVRSRVSIIPFTAGDLGHNLLSSGRVPSLSDSPMPARDHRDNLHASSTVGPRACAIAAQNSARYFVRTPQRSNFRQSRFISSLLQMQTSTPSSSMRQAWLVVRGLIWV